ncbi:hypothetical protein R5R35_009657 [Gryllus longicercus]|uniref:[histone H3]-dimethyl-L-lysine(9) demethylase n=1 Tax=Gryllus longicercus TaxID=2509291 RepID=A0AAN9Z109_9ORTH
MQIISCSEQDVKMPIHLYQRNTSNCWSLIHPRPPACGPSHDEEQRKRADQEAAAAAHQQRLLSERMRQESRERQPSYYPPTVPRSSNTAKSEYPPPAHSRISSIKTEKPPSGHTALPKAEPNLNLFNYHPAYQQPAFLPHDTKVKAEPKNSLSSLAGGKGSGATLMMEREREMMLPNPPPLMNDIKNSVIVKNEGKSPHHSETSKVPPSHSSSPKLRVTDMISSQPHYLSPSLQQHKPPTGVYDYRSPTHSPHHLAPRHTPSPHHSIGIEPQNLASVGKVHSRPQSQQSSPHNHPHRQSPHQHVLIQQTQHPSPPEQRYTAASNPASHAYGLPKANMAPYPYPPTGLVASGSHYSLTPQSSASTGSKPKVVSSPAPPHIYGKPGLSSGMSPGITSGTPVCRPPDTNVNSPLPLTSKAPLSSSVSPSPYQQMSHHHPPPQQAPPGPAPPPAHSSRTSMDHRIMYDSRQYPGASLGMPGGPISKPPPHNQGSSPPSAAAAPMPPASRSSPLQIHHSHQVHPASIASMYQTQTQPLDLGVSSERNRDEMTGSPKRKGMPMQHSPVGTPLMDANKKRRCDPALGVATPPHPLQPAQSIQTLSQPMLARVSEPSPLIASAATTITTVVNTAAYCTQAMTMVVSVPSETTMATTLSSSPHPVPIRTGSGDGSRPASTGSVSALTPAHTPTPAPSLFPPTGSTVPSQRSSPVSLAPPANCSSPNLPQQQSPQMQQQQQQQLQQTPTLQQQQQPPPSQQTPAQSTPQQQPANNTPATPAKPAPPSSADSEKSNSPGPARPSTGSSYPVHKLKKAWLQRHSGEDGVSNAGGVGTGSCVSLPILSSTSNNVPSSNNNTIASNKECGGSSNNNTVSSFANVGSTAVASIPKGKPGAGKNRKPGSKDVTVNGHASDIKPSLADDSSSSDNELEQKSPPKRKPPIKKKRKAVKKGGGDEKKKKVPPAAPPSDSGSDSEKESGSDKDSDSGASTNQSGGGRKTANGGNGGTGNGGGNSGGNAGNNKEPRKRGRRPKSSKNERGEEPRQKKSRDDPPAPQRNPFRKPPVSQLKKTGESFLQDGPCHEVAPKLAKCRECRWTPNQRSRNMPNIFCRFYAFRRLRYTKNGQLAIAGFSDPHRDASEDDTKLWLPQPDTPPADLDVQMSRFLLSQVGDQFCDLLKQEEESVSIHMADDKTVAWKRVVKGVREMCDVCETTLFNFHWACGKCGFAVCIDCYKGRKNGTIKIWGEAGKDRDDFSWLLCTNRQPHEQEKLMLTQIIASDSLRKLGRKCHEIRALYNIPQYCGCPLSKEVAQKPLNGISKDLLRSLMKNEPINGLKVEKKEKDGANTDMDKKNGSANGAVKQEDKNSPLSWLADVVLQNEDKKDIGDDLGSTSDSDDDKEGNYSTLRELLIRPSHKSNGNGSRSASPSNANATGSNSSAANSQNNTSTKGSKKLTMDTLDAVISSVIESSVQNENTDDAGSDTKPVILKHFIRRYYRPQTGREPLPIRIMTLTESQALFPDVPHSWLCDGKLLRLTDPNHKGNYRIFQDQWKRGQPVIVSDVAKHLDMNLWHPDSFSRDFGDDKNDLVNCMTGNLVPNQPMRKFWEGFENFAKRLKDERGNPMLLKLKDWPPGDDFAEMLPSRFSDLMRVLPLSEYTHRTGRLNLASRLPECFVRPDLGPKMYNAYGSALHPSKGTTNLHLDISDAVNVMVYVGIPKDGDCEELQQEVSKAIEDAPCDFLTKRRVREKDELPGALWHIYNANDADKIRDLLNKVAVERGVRLEPHHDPIHDQSWYLDAPLRERLYKEYCVEGYAIVQCLGDAVFIPAGAPHQVRNLHNCIKVAEDFVSPENVSHCFHLTQEFRELSDTHSNHEDKLQIKNIIYHAVKDSLSVLTKLAGIYEDATSSACAGGESLMNGTNSEDKPSANGNNEDSNNGTNNSASSSEAEVTVT